MLAGTNYGDIVSQLRGTFDSGKTRPIEFRKGQLQALSKMLEEGSKQLIDAVGADLRKPPTEAELTELIMCTQELKFTLGNIDAWTAPEKVPTQAVQMKGLTTSYIQSEPLGVVLIIGPWNYPISLIIQPLIGAIAAGNCVVIKPSEVAENVSRALSDLLSRYLDQSVVRVCEGGVAETTAILKEKFDHIFYTGNGVVGRVVMRAAAEHLTPVTLELGGKSPCIVAADAHLQISARRIVAGKIMNSGQTCIAPDYLLVEEKIVDQFIDALKAAITEFLGANPKDSADYGRMINDRHWKRVTGLMQGENIVFGGDSDAATRYISPTIIRLSLTDASTHKVMQEEIFGPILPLIPVPSIDAAIRFVNGTGAKPLALYVYTTTNKVAQEVLNRTSSGGAAVNECVLHATSPYLPFGGVGESGMGSYHGRSSFDTFSHRRSVLDKTLWGDFALRYPPYTPNKVWALKHML